MIAALAISALLLAGCGGKTQNTAAQNDSVAVENAEEDVAVAQQAGQEKADSVKTVLTDAFKSQDKNLIQKVFTNIQSEYANLVNSGKLTLAKTYAMQIQDYIRQNKETISNFTKNNSVIATLAKSIENLPVGENISKEEIQNNIQNNLKDLGNNVKQGVKTVVEERKNAVNKKVEEAKNKSQKEMEEAKSKAKKSVDEAAKNANEAINKIGL